MNRLTLFTVLISVIVLITVAHLALENRFTAYEGLTSVVQTPSPAAQNQDGTISSSETLSEATTTEEGTVFEASPDETSDEFSALLPVTEETDEKIPETVTAPEPSPYLSSNDLKEAGFQELALKEQPFGGILFQLIDLSDAGIEYQVTDDAQIYGIVTAFPRQDETDLLALYTRIKERALSFTDITVNETNQYADGSFYVNDSRRTGTAFLVVKIKTVLYTFAYPKANHSYYKNLISLLHGKKS